MKNDELPIGFTMALAMNESAMEKFAQMDEEQRQRTVLDARAVKTKEEMHRFVASIAKDT